MRNFLASAASNVTVHTPSFSVPTLIGAGVLAVIVMYFGRKLKGFVPAILALIGTGAVLLYLSHLHH